MQNMGRKKLVTRYSAIAVNSPTCSAITFNSRRYNVASIELYMDQSRRSFNFIHRDMKLVPLEDLL